MTRSGREYIHGYSPREIQRLVEQAGILEELLHSGTSYSQGELVLEAGCGVGAQTAILHRRNPQARLVSMDISFGSLQAATGHTITAFLQGDIMAPPFQEGRFDHVFACFVLEHMARPIEALEALFSLLKPGGTVTVIEGDHEACVWTPATKAAANAWRAMIRCQEDLGHDPMIGRRLHGLLASAGYEVQYDGPRPIYASGSDRRLLGAVINQIIVPMASTARQRALEAGYISAEQWDRGLADLAHVAVAPDGAFFYSWFKAVGRKPF